MGNKKTFNIIYPQGLEEVEIMQPRVINTRCYRMSFTVHLKRYTAYLNNVIVVQKGGDGDHYVQWPADKSSDKQYKSFWIQDSYARHQIECAILGFYSEITGVSVDCDDCEVRVD